LIELTRLNGKKFFLNPELVESLEAMPDTTIRLSNGKTYVVKELCEEVNQAIFLYRVKLLQEDKNPKGQIPDGWNVISGFSSEPNKED